MKLDPVLSEVRRIREEYALQFHGDVRAMMEDLRRRHAESGRESVSRKPKLRHGKSGAVKAAEYVHGVGIALCRRCNDWNLDARAPDWSTPNCCG